MGRPSKYSLETWQVVDSLTAKGLSSAAISAATGVKSSAIRQRRARGAGVKLAPEAAGQLRRVGRPRKEALEQREVKTFTSAAPSSVVSAGDEQNIAQIRSFLEESGIPYTQQGDVFSLTSTDVEVRYVNSRNLKIGYKRFGYEGVSQRYCFELSRKAEEAGRRIMWWRDFEVENPRKNSVIKSYLLAACGKTQNRVYARDCEVREIPSRELRTFLDTNCFYGYRSASLNLGLYLKKDRGGFPAGTLVMMWSVGHPFYGKSLYDLEVVRASTILNTQVVGGASKLFSYVKALETIRCGSKDVRWNSLSFYVDFDHNTGKSLPILGFKFWNYSGGGFMNLNLETGEAFNRKPMIHKQVMEWMAQGKVISVPLAGVKTYVWCKNGDYSKFPGVMLT